MKLNVFVTLIFASSLLVPGCTKSLRQDESVVQQSTQALVRGDWERAQAAAQVALEISPDNARAAYNLARVYEHYDRPAEAFLMYRRIIETDSQETIAPELWDGKMPRKLIDIAREKLNFTDAHGNVSFVNGEQDADGDGIADNRDRCAATPPGARVDDMGCWTLLNVFDPGQVTILASALPLLDEVAAVLAALPKLYLEVQGHTDSSGSNAYNLQLSERRALEVVEYLKTKGISGDRLLAKGYGFNRPQASNETEQGRALNRRIVFVQIPSPGN